METGGPRGRGSVHSPRPVPRPLPNAADMRLPPPPGFSRSLALAACAGLLAVGCVRAYDDPNAPSLTSAVAEGDPPPAAPEDDLTDARPFRVEFVTTEGPFVVEARPDWAPLGAARFKTLVKEGYFDGAAFFRVLPGFVAQFGLAADPAQTARWEGTDLRDEPVQVSNTPGTLTYAKSGPNTRTTQLFINLGDNSGSLDPQGFSPFAKIISGGDVPGKFYSGYGERPDQGAITARGADYLDSKFPKLDTITTARLIPREEWATAAATDAGDGGEDQADPAALAGLAAPESDDAKTEVRAQNEEPAEEEPADEESADEGSGDGEPAGGAEMETDPPEPGPDPTPAPDPDPEPNPTPEPGPDPTPTPDPDPEPNPEPEPEPDPAPGPEESPEESDEK